MRPVFGRRTFLLGAAVTAAGARAAIRPSWRIAPNSRVGVALIGAGAMGRRHLDALLDQNAARVAAICDPDALRLRAALGAAHRRGNTPAGYADYREMLACERGVDTVCIAAPDHWHAPAVRDALAAGKAVYCEAPLGMTVEEERRVRDTAARLGIRCQTSASWRDSCEPLRAACDDVRAGALGPVTRAVCFIGEGPYAPITPGSAPPPHLDWNLYLGAAAPQPYHPLIHPYHFRFFGAFGGGLLGEWGPPMFDAALWGMGRETVAPALLAADHTADPDSLFDCPRAAHIRYACGDARLEWVQGAYAAAPAGVHYGVHFIAPGGECCVNRSGAWLRRQGAWSLVAQADATAARPLDAFMAELRAPRPVPADSAAAHQAALIAHAGRAALRMPC